TPADDVIAVAQDLPARAPQERGQPLLALLEREGTEIGAVEVEQVEDQVAQPGPGIAAECLLESLEARSPGVVQDHALAVKPGGVARERRTGARDRAEALGPVLPAANEHARAPVLDAAERAVAVVLDLVQPVVSRRRCIGDDGELRTDALRQRTA